MKRIVSLLCITLLGSSLAFSLNIIEDNRYCNGYPDISQVTGYVLHITSSTFPAGEGNIQVTFTGDYSGQANTPFDIGPYAQPFSVTLSAPEILFVSGASNTLINWRVNEENQYPSPITEIAVSTTPGSPVVNVIVQYAHVEPTPIHSHVVWIEPPEKTVGTREDFTLEIHLDTGNSRVAAYEFELTWIMPQEGAIIYVDTSIGTSGVEAGPDGFVAIALANDPGNLVISGYDTTGSEPGTDLHFLTVHFTSGPRGASTPVNIMVKTLADQNGSDIGVTDVIGTVLTVADTLTGDVDGDSEITIIDALLTAQYYVGLDPASFNPAAADVNCDGTIDIVDALLIARFYVGLITQFC